MAWLFVQMLHGFVQHWFLFPGAHSRKLHHAYVKDLEDGHFAGDHDECEDQHLFEKKTWILAKFIKLSQWYDIKVIKPPNKNPYFDPIHQKWFLETTLMVYLSKVHLKTLKTDPYTLIYF